MLEFVPHVASVQQWLSSPHSFFRGRLRGRHCRIFQNSELTLYRFSIEFPFVQTRDLLLLVTIKCTYFTGLRITSREARFYSAIFFRSYVFTRRVFTRKGSVTRLEKKTVNLARTNGYGRTCRPYRTSHTRFVRESH